MNNIQDKNNKYCTGCGGCVQVCPVNAIIYRINTDGFFEAFVDESKCISCGKCKKVCSKFANYESRSIKEGELLSARSKNEEVLKTATSGGIAYEIAEYGIKNGYKILGTIYDYDKNIAKAVIINNIDELQEIKGSKYIQSKTDIALKQLLEDCKKDKNAKYIIFGTPCQIAGISNVLKLQNVLNEVIKVDLFCHGVPSYIIWNKYLEQVKNKFNLKQISECNFRSKHYGWHQYCIELKDVNGNTAYLDDGKSEFYKLFFDNMLLNKSCYDCIYRKDKTYADIRLGDYWGKKYYKNQTGVSAVLINTNKGKNVINKILEQIEIIDKGDIKDFLKVQSTEKYSNEESNLEFWKNGKIEEKNLKEIINEYRKKMTHTQKLKVTVKDIMGKISPKCKYNIKKIYYSVENKRRIK